MSNYNERLEAARLVEAERVRSEQIVSQFARSVSEAATRNEEQRKRSEARRLMEQMGITQILISLQNAWGQGEVIDAQDSVVEKWSLIARHTQSFKRKQEHYKDAFGFYKDVEYRGGSIGTGKMHGYTHSPASRSEVIKFGKHKAVERVTYSTDIKEHATEFSVSTIIGDEAVITVYDSHDSHLDQNPIFDIPGASERLGPKIKPEYQDEYRFCNRVSVSLPILDAPQLGRVFVEAYALGALNYRKTHNLLPGSIWQRHPDFDYS